MQLVRGETDGPAAPWVVRSLAEAGALLTE
jgi:hypothetical protein